MSNVMPCGWRSGRLGDICLRPPQNGVFIKNPTWGMGTSYINVHDIYKNEIVDTTRVQRLSCDASLLNKYGVQVNDLLFVRSSLKREGIGQCCTVGEIDEPAIFDCHLIRMTPNPAKADALFLTYYFGSTDGKQDIIARSKTTTMTTLNQQSLIETVIPLPPLPAQRAIAVTLRTVQDARDARRRELALERERKAALMEDLFTCGVRGEPCKPTEIGMMPESWDVVRFGSLFETQLGKMLSPKAKTGNGAKPYLRNANVQWGKVLLDDLYKMDFSETEMKKFNLRCGDLLMCEGGEIGRTAMWKGEMSECYYQKAIHRIRPRYESIMPAFYLYFLEWAFRIADLYGIAGTQTTIAHLPKEKLVAMYIPFPAIREQRDIAEVLTACDRKIAALEAEAGLHDELFRALLDELMTGRVSAVALAEDFERE